MVQGRDHRAAPGGSTQREPVADLEILLEATALTFYAGDYDAVVALALDAQRIACETDAERFTLAAVTAVAAEIAGDHDRGAALAAQALELAEQLDDPVNLVWAAWTAAREGGAAAEVSYALAPSKSPASGGS